MLLNQRFRIMIVPPLGPEIWLLSGQVWPISRMFWPNFVHVLANSCQFGGLGPTLVNFGQTLVDFCSHSAVFGPRFRASCGPGQFSAHPRRNRAHSGPILADCWPKLVRSGLHLVDFGDNSVEIGRFRPICAELCQFRPTFDQICATSSGERAQSGGNSARVPRMCMALVPQRLSSNTA